MFPETGIKIISATLHSHVTGRKMKLRHVRNGIELDRIVEDDTYDFNYQQVRQLENETTVLPGDYLITDCAYEVCLTCSYSFCVSECIIKLHANAKQNKTKKNQ